MTINVTDNTFSNIITKVIDNVHLSTKIKLGQNKFLCSLNPEIIGTTSAPSITSASVSQVSGTSPIVGTNLTVSLYKVSACASNSARRTIETLVGTTTTTSNNWTISNFVSPLVGGESLVATITADAISSSPFSAARVVCTPYTITATPTIASCATNGVGSITLNLNLNYTWVNTTNTTVGTGTGATISNLPAGTYSITGTDSNGCTASVTNVIVDHADHLQLVSWYNTGNIPTASVNWGATLNDPTMTGWTGITTGTSGCVTTISLSNKNISGNLPNFNLPNLRVLLLENNQLNDSIPNFNFLNLNALSLSSNQLSGKIPLFNFPNLEILVLRGNQLNGTIPLFNFSNLKTFDLSHNQISGVIPFLNSPYLEYFNISYNRLSGNIPNIVVLSNIYYFSIGNNLFNFGNLNNAWTVLNNATYNSNNWSRYTPQDTLLLLNANTHTLTADLAGMPDASQLAYTWYRNGVQQGSPITGSNTFTPSQSGTYTYSVTHAVITQPNVSNRNLVLNSQSVSFIYVPCTTVINTNDAGYGSLREAINCANTNVGADTITFAIPGTGQQVITLASALPSLTDAGTVIDGGAWVNGVPQIKLTQSASNTTQSISGFSIHANNIEIQGFQGSLIHHDLGYGVKIHHNWIEPMASVWGIVARGFDCKIYQNTVKKSVNSAINVHGVLAFNNVHIYENIVEDLEIGINVLNKTLVENNIVLNSTSANAFGIYVNGVSNIIKNNTISRGKGIAIYHSDSCTILQNRLFSSEIEIGYSNYITIDSCHIKNAGQTNGINIIKGSNIDIGKILPNKFENTNHAIVVDSINVDKVKVDQQNIFICNQKEITSIVAPIVNVHNTNLIAGTTLPIRPNATIEVFKVITCNSTNQQSKTLLGTTTTDVNGNWSLTASNFLNTVSINDKITAWVTPNFNTGTAIGRNTSSFASYKQVVPACSMTVTLQNQNNTLTAIPSNGTAPYSYSWSNGATTASITATVAGTYSVTVTDGNACTSENSLLSCASNVTISQANASNTTIYTFVANAPNGASYTYEWFYQGNLLGTGSNVTHNFNTCGTFSIDLKVNVGNGCPLQTVSKTVTINSSISSVSISKTPNGSICQGSPVTLSAAAIGSGQIASFAWSNNSTGNSTTVSSTSAVGPIIYSVTATDNLGCTKTGSTVVTYLATPSATITSVTQPLCYGAATGSATVNATGGTLPYTYAWSNGATTSVANDISGGLHSVTVTGGNGCFSTVSTTVNQPSAIVLSTTQTNVLCSGQSTGVAEVIPSGGTPYYTYLWSNGATTSSISNLLSGTYTVTVTDANACSKSISLTITAPLPFVVAINNVASNSNYTATVSGGVAPYTYVWNTGATTAAISNYVPAGTYTVTVTDANGCTGVKSIDNCGSNVGVSHNVDSAAVVTFYTSAPSSNNYIYKWYSDTSASAVLIDTGATPTIDFGSAGFHNIFLVVTMPNSPCFPEKDTISYSFTISCNLAASINAADTVCLSSSTTISVVPTAGIAPYSYYWNTGEDTAAISVNSTVLGPVAYEVTVTDALGCEIFISKVITFVPTPNVSITGTNLSCNSNNSGAAAALASGGTPSYTYLWSNAQRTPSISGLSAGTYSVTATDINACKAVSIVTITEPNILTSSTTVTNVSCHGGNNGTATAIPTGGTTAYTYVWSNGQSAPTAIDLVAGTYFVTITDAKGCTTISRVTINEPTAPLTSSITATDVSCNGGSNGTATAIATGGTAPYTYLWSNGQTNQTATGLEVGYHDVTVKDVNGCSISNGKIISEPSKVVIRSTVDSVKCRGGNTGEISLNVTGGVGNYTYQWSNNSATQGLNNIAAGLYTVTVTNNNICTKVSTINVYQPDSLTVSTTVTVVSCYGAKDGTVLAKGFGGNSPYTYLWSTPNNVITGLAPGIYTVTATDSKICSIVKDVTVTEPTEIVLTVTNTSVSCNNNSDGTATVSATGGTGSHSYLWSNGSTTSSISGLSKGIYGVTVTDSNGCMKVKTVDISIVPQITINVSSAGTLVSCSGVVDATLTCTVTSSSSASLSYQWLRSPNGSSWTNIAGATANTLKISSSGYYRCKVSNSCGDKLSNTIIANGFPFVTIIPDPGNCKNKTIKSNSSPNGGSYQWQKRSNTNCSLGTWQNIAGANAATYTPTIGGQYRLIYLPPGCNNAILSNATCISNIACTTAPTSTSSKESISILENIDFNTYQPEWIDANEIFSTVEISNEGIATEIKATDSSLFIAPNPTSDYLRLQYTLVENGMTQLSIVNMAGARKMVWREHKNAGDYTEILAQVIEELPAGMYFIELATTTKIITQKMIKVK